MKILPVFFAILMVILLPACGAAGTVAPSQASATPAPSLVSATPAPSQAPATSAPSQAPATSAPSQAPATAAPITEADLVLMLDGTAYKLKTDAQPLLDALGGDYELEKAPSCLYKGEDKTFAYKDITIFTFPIDGKDIMDEIEINDSRFATNRDVKVGDTREAIIKAYGEGYIDDGDAIRYVLGDPEDDKSPMIYFVFEGGKAVTVGLYSASNVQ